TVPTQHIFRKDLVTAEILLVSRNAAGQQGTDQGNNFNPVIEHTGRYVFFETDADNFGFSQSLGDPTQIVRKDMAGTGTVTLVSRALTGTSIGGNSSADSPSVTPDGRYVTFHSNADNLVSGVSGSNIFRADMSGPEPVIEFVADLGGYVGAGLSSLSASGRYVLLTTDLALDPGDNNGLADVYLRDMRCPIGADDGCAEFAWLSTAMGSVAWNGNSQLSSPHSLSADGRFALFESFSNGSFGSGPPDDNLNLYVKDLQTGARARVSVSANGVTKASAALAGGSISADGLSVSFSYNGTDLGTDKTGSTHDIFVKDLPLTLTTANAVGALTSFSKGFPVPADVSNDSLRPALSSTGEFVFFQSAAINLVPIDVNELTSNSDVFRGFNPGVVDTDGDGLSDRKEQQLGTGENFTDSDADNLDDGEEFYLVGTDPLNPDTDGDSLQDDVDPEPLNNPGLVAGNTALQAYRVENAANSTYDLMAVDPAAPVAPPLTFDIGIPFSAGDDFPLVETGSYDGTNRRLLNTQFGFITYVKNFRVYRVDLRSGVSNRGPHQVGGFTNACALNEVHVDAQNPLNSLLEVETSSTMDC
ncbi:MAG: hypothetical protein ACREA0_11425, partial [bacterium]